MILLLIAPWGIDFTEIEPDELDLMLLFQEQGSYIGQFLGRADILPQDHAVLPKNWIAV